MNNKKRIMFTVDDDYYYITIKVIVVLIQLDCYKKKFIDYRKLAFLILFMKSSENINLLIKSIQDYNTLSIFEREKLISIYYKGCMEQPIVKRVLFYLEKRGLVKLIKNSKYICVDVLLNSEEEIDNIFLSEQFSEDRKNINKIYEQFNRIKSVKYDTFIKRIFGDSEVSKWEC